MIDPRLLESISKSDFKNNLVEYLKQVQNEIADVRVGDYSTETRKAVIELLNTLVINKIRGMTLPEKPVKEDY